MTDMVMTATPELLDDYARRAGGVADALSRQAVELADAIARFEAGCDRALLPGPLVDPADLRSLSARIRDLGAEVAAVAAAVHTADHTTQVDIVIMSQSAFLQALAAGRPAAPTRPVTPSVGAAVPRTVDDWKRLAYDRAGVDTTGWDPRADMRINDARIQAIWDRYGALYLADPTHLWWAGMAKLGGATVYAGMMDLKSIVDITDREERGRAMREWVAAASPGFGDDAVGWLASRLIDLTGDQVDQFIGLFQTMEKAIADDLLWQHEAYREGGLAALAPYRDTPAMPKEVYDAWVKIDSGDPAQVSDGNRELLKQEQQGILPDRYDELRSTVPGSAFAEVLTLTTESIAPGGRPYAEVMQSDRHLGPIPLPDPEVPVYRQVIPGSLGRVRGNIADTNDRWEWIERDMWPSFARFRDDHPADLDQMMHAPVRDLADGRRKAPLPFDR